MPREGKRPASDGPEDTPPPPAPQPLGALSFLPDVLLALLCPFLSGRELCRLGASCAILYWGPHCVMPRLRVHRRLLLESESESEEEMGRGRSAVSRLARRAAGASVREVHIDDPRLIEPFLSALTEEDRVLGALTSLRLAVVDGLMTKITEAATQVMGEALAEGRLPVLRELELHIAQLGTRVPQVRPLWEALGQGACPRLQSLRLEGPEPEEMMDVAAAVCVRQGRCEELTELSIDFDPAAGGGWGVAGRRESLDRLLRQLSPSLETVRLRDTHHSAVPTVLSALLEPGCRVLQSLTLTQFHWGEAPGCGDVLVRALARGAAPGLRQLRLASVECSESDEAWRELEQAMQVGGGCLSRLQSLELQSVFCTAQQIETFARALGSGHGCPELEMLCLPGLEGPGPVGALLAPAFRSPSGLSLLKRLDLRESQLGDADLLLEALQDRPHARRDLEELELSCCDVIGLDGLAGAMQPGGPLAGLKQLDMPGENADVAAVQEWVVGLVTALASGAGRQLETIEWVAMATVEPINLFLRALAVDGACPRLRSCAPCMYGYKFHEGARLDVDALGAVLAGRAACSATLTEVNLGHFQLDSAELAGLAACLRADEAVQLEALNLQVHGTGIVGMMDVLDALRGRAGSRLQRLEIWLWECGEQEAKEVAGRLIDMIAAGSLPAISSSTPPRVDGPSSWEGEVREQLWRAVRSRTEAL